MKDIETKGSGCYHALDTTYAGNIETFFLGCNKEEAVNKATWLSKSRGHGLIVLQDIGIIQKKAGDNIQYYRSSIAELGEWIPKGQGRGKPKRTMTAVEPLK